MRIALTTACAVLAFASAARADNNNQQAITQSPVQQTIVSPSASTGASTSNGGVSTSNGGVSTSNAGGAILTQDYQRSPVSTAYAAPLTFSQGTCYVSASAGGQGVTFGLSMALPFEDKACTVRATAQALNALGEREAALRYLSAHDVGVRAALDSSR